MVGSAAITNSPSELLRAGGLVWLFLFITFAVLYWELDLGGPGERAHIEPRLPDLAFPQDLNPSITVLAGTRPSSTTCTGGSQITLPSARPTSCL